MFPNKILLSCFMVTLIHSFTNILAFNELSDSKKTPCINEDCCEELREENIKRMMEINQLYVEVDENKLEMDENTLEISSLNTKIASLARVVEEKVEKFSCENTLGNQLGQKVCELEQDIYDVVPLGTILPWVNKPSKDASHQEDIPDGWQLCDGSTISTGIWNGLSTPDLNTEGKFVRGGRVQDVLTMEDSMIQDHGHTDAGHSHSDSGHTHTDSGHSHSYEYTAYGGGGASSTYGYEHNYYYQAGLKGGTAAESSANIQSAQASITTSSSGIGGIQSNEGLVVGGENRPANMRVIYIIKIV